MSRSVVLTRAGEKIDPKTRTRIYFVQKVLVYKAKTPTPNRSFLPCINPAQIVMSHDRIASPDRNSCIETALNLVQALYPELLDFEYSESVLALDRLDSSLSTLCLLLDTHGLSFGAHNSSSAHK